MKKNIELNVNLEDVIEQLPATLNDTTPLGLDDWDSYPIPSRKEVANFYDGNNYRIVFISGIDTYKMLTFSMEEGCRVYWENTSYGRWYFTDKNKASNFLLYDLTEAGIGEATSVTWASSSSNYLNTRTQTHRRDVSYILFSNATIYDKDKETVLFELMGITELYPAYVHLKSAGFNKDVRIKPNQQWMYLLDIDYVKSDKSEVKEIVISGDYQPVYSKAGSYLVTVQVALTGVDNVISRPLDVVVNVYEDGTEAYPNNIPFPPQDGMKEVFVFDGKDEIGLLTFSSTQGVQAYQYSTTSIRFFDGKFEGGNASYSGTYLYWLRKGKWEFQSGSENAPNSYPTYYPTVKDGANSIIYSTKDCYSKNIVAEENLLREKDGEIERLDYSIKNRIYEVPYDLPDVKPIIEEIGAHHYYIGYCGGKIALATVEFNDDSIISDFHLGICGSSSSSLQIIPSHRLDTTTYRYFNTATGEWDAPVVATNEARFNSTYVKPTTASTLNKAKTVNDLVIYTTFPIVLKSSLDNDDICEIRKSDNRMVADENSVPPIVTDITIEATSDKPYTVDTDFKFNYECELEDLEGIAVSQVEWDNRLNNYPSGTNIVSVRVKDNRELWSDWFSKEIEIERPFIPDNVPIGNYPLQSDGAPFEHYVIYKSDSKTGYTYFAFTLNEGEELPNFYLNTANSSTTFYIRCDKPISILKEYAIYSSYENGEWGTSGVMYSSSVSGGYFLVDKPVVQGVERSAIYYSTFPIYSNNKYTNVHAYPSPKPEFPLGLGVICSHEDVWTTDNVTVRTQINANGQQWKDFKYRINGGEFVALDGDTELVFTESGIYHVEFVIYNQDNIETKAEAYFRIDKEAPVLSVTEDGNYLVFNATDSLSGIQTIQYRLVGSDWITITNGFKLDKPTYGGLYAYELMATDNMGNTNTIQYEYDVPKIPIETVEVTPTNFELSYGATQKLTVSILPTNHNEQYEVIYESLSPYVTVSTSGTIKNANPYYTGEASVKVIVNDKEVIVPLHCNAGKMEYPSGYPSLYDIYNIEGEYTDFIVYHYGSLTYHLMALKREDVESIFYIKNSSNPRLCFTTEGAITEAVRFEKLDETVWNKKPTVLTVNANEVVQNFGSRYPSNTIVFSTIDIYADETGEILAYPKDTLPPTNKARVWVETNNEEGTTVTSANWVVNGEDMGDGLTRLTYSINNGEEIEIENGGVITLEDNGDYEIQAFAYNNHGVRTKSEIYRVTILASYPSDMRVKIAQEFATLQLSFDNSLVRYKHNGVWQNLKVIPSHEVLESERQVQVLISGVWYTILIY